MTDPIADLLTRIRNAYMAKQETTQVPYSKIKHDLVKLLKKNNFVKGVKVVKAKPFSHLEVSLKYIASRPAITHIERVSKPGRRLYVRSNQIKPVLSGKGMAIISTSKGLLKGTDARNKSLGGELVCKLW